MISQEYEIRIRGTLSRALQYAFEPLCVESEPDGSVTVLRGIVHDQSELTGILTTIDSLGLVLVEVRPARPADIHRTAVAGGNLGAESTPLHPPTWPSSARDDVQVRDVRDS